MERTDSCKLSSDPCMHAWHTYTHGYKDIHTLCKREKEVAGEMTQQLRALTALAGNLGSIPNIHMMAHNYL